MRQQQIQDPQIH